MNYDEFKEAWLIALRESRLRTFGVDALRESIDPTDRIGTSMVEPYSRPDPFTVCAKFRWRWDALNSARTATSEEDVGRVVRSGNSQSSSHASSLAAR